MAGATRCGPVLALAATLALAPCSPAARPGKLLAARSSSGRNPAVSISVETVTNKPGPRTYTGYRYAVTSAPAGWRVLVQIRLARFRNGARTVSERKAIVTTPFSTSIHCGARCAVAITAQAWPKDPAATLRGTITIRVWSR